MLIQNCFKGQRVVYKESGRCATVLSVSHNVGKITIAFENAERKDVSPAALEPATAEASHKTESGIAMRPCPNCATKMPASESTCPNCGFEYGVKRSNAPDRKSTRLNSSHRT